MAANQTRPPDEIRYSRDLGLAQVASLGLRLGLAVMLFLVLRPMVAASGRGSLWALVLGCLVWLPALLSYLELSSRNPEGDIYTVAGGYSSGLLPFLLGWCLLLAELVAAGLLARQAAAILVPWLPAGLQHEGLAGIGILIVALAVAGQRQHTWQRTDDWVTGSGVVATIILVMASLLVTPAPPAVAQRAPGDFRGLMGGIVILVLLLVPVLQMGEWKAAAIRSPGKLPRVSLIVLALLVAAGAGVLWAGLRLDGAALASGGVPELLQELPSPTRLATGLLFAVLLVAAVSSLLLSGSRILGQLVRDGYLPEVKTRDRHQAIALGLALGTLVSGVAVLAPLSLEVVVVALMAAVAAGINLFDILAQPGKEHRPAPGVLTLPFPPLVPALGLGLVVFMAVAISPLGLLVLASTLGLGWLIYLVYGRTTERQRQEDRVLFGYGTPPPGEHTEIFRVLVPLPAVPREQRALLAAATTLAAAEQGEVVALKVVTLSPQQPRSEGVREAREKNQMLRWALKEGDWAAPVRPVTRIGYDKVGSVIDTAREEHCELILINWQPAAGRPQRLAAREPGMILTNGLVRGAPAMVAALNGPWPQGVRRILVPTAGGPHAPSAARLALDLARQWQAEVVGLTILRDGTDETAIARAEEVIRETFAGLPGAEEVQTRVVSSQEPIAQILVAEADTGFDLVLLGASNEGLLDRVLFGDVPEQVAEQTDVPSMMVRSARPPQQAWAQRAWDQVQTVLPTLSVEEQIDLYRTLRRGARPSISYFVLIVLSALIATLGLWQNSVAVIIGAMLVAPLMTPIMAASLGIVLGDGRMIRVAAESIAKGMLLGIGVATFFSLLLRSPEVGSEIMGRTQPGLLDLMVALASGAAGAYALARKEVSAALPGVAIAAALMPPLCTIGIGLATFAGPIAMGASLLFLTNLAAIIVAGGLVFLLLGIRPRDDEQERQANFRRGVTLALVLLVVVSVLLGLLSLRSYASVQQQLAVTGWIVETAETYEGLEVLSTTVERRGDTLQVHTRLQTSGEPVDEGTVQGWSKELSAETGRHVELTVDQVPVLRLEGQSE